MSRSAYGHAIKKLSLRAYSEQELRQTLQKADYPASEIEEALEKLLKNRFLDDAKLAESLYYYYTERKPCGPALLRQKLLQKGLTVEIIGATLDSYDEQTELELAVTLADKYCQRAGRSSASLARFLQRKGFRRNVVLTIIRNTGPVEGI